MPLLSLVGTGVAVTSGEGHITGPASLRGLGVAAGEGFGWLSMPPVPKVSLELEDLWFYGYAKVKHMQGRGVAVSSGSGEF